MTKMNSADISCKDVSRKFSVESNIVSIVFASSQTGHCSAARRSVNCMFWL